LRLKELQERQARFMQERGWDRFPASLTFIHLVEELGEIGDQILWREGYKAEGLGHERGENLPREFGQVLSLLLQLATQLDIDLEEAFLQEFRAMERRFPKEEWRSYMERYGREG
jgi:NTP pyrophosphatase (non-canonical NTP hydrolase)